MVDVTKLKDDVKSWEETGGAWKSWRSLEKGPFLEETGLEDLENVLKLDDSMKSLHSNTCFVSFWSV